MAPEQWTDPGRVGPRSDLYALGILAYEALTGRRPFDADTAEEFADRHLTAPVPPVGAGLPPGLDRVFQRALAKRPEDRFFSALDLAAALRTEMESRMVARVRAAAQHWADRGKPAALLWRDDVLAELEQWMQRSARTGTLTTIELEFADASKESALAELQARTRRMKWARRAAVAAATIAAALVFFGFQVLARLETQQARYEADLAQQRERDAKEREIATAITSEVEQGRSALLHDDMVEAQRHFGEAWRRGDQSPSTAFMYARALEPRHAELARLPAISGRMWSAAFSPDGNQIVTTDDTGVQIWNAGSYRPVSTLPHGDVVYHAVYTADGARLITAAGDGEVRIWNPATGDLVRELRLDGRTPQWSLAAVSPDGRVVAAADLSGAIAVAWDAGTGGVLAELALDRGERPSLRFSTDGRWLAAGGGGTVHVFDAANWRSAAAMPGTRIAWDPTGPRLILGSIGGDASIWSVTTGARLHHLHESGDPVDAVAYSPDGQRVALALRSGTVQVFEADTARLASTGNYLGDKILSIEFDPSSRLVAAAGVNGRVAVSEATTGMPIAVLEGPNGVVSIAHFDPSSRRVVAASWDGTARIWDAGSPYRRWSSERLSDGCGLVGTAEAPNGRLLAVACAGHATRIWDTASDQLVAELPALAQPRGDLPVPFPAVSAAGDRAAIARGNAAELYALPGGRLVRTIAHGAAVTAVAFGPGGEVASGDASGAVLVTREAQVPLVLQRSADAPIGALAVLPDSRIAVADTKGHVRVLGGSNATVAVFDTGIRSRMLRPSPDGSRLLAVPSFSGNTALPLVLDLERGEATRLDGPHVYSARWVPGGILTAHADGSARLWSPDGARRRIYRGGPRFLVDAAPTPEGSMVVGGGGDGALHFWDAATGRQLWALPAHKLQVLGLDVAPWGIVTRGDGGEVSRWSLPLPSAVIGAGKIEAVGPDP